MTFGWSRITDSEFCWRGLNGGKSGQHNSLPATSIERVEKRALSSAGHEPETVGDISSTATRAAAIPC
jgi:hypothetical protein